MYIGGTDERAMHHLVAEILDNSMDEAVAGHADTIWLEMLPGNYVLIRDNGRGMPVDPHPKFKNKSAWKSSSRPCTPAASSTARFTPPRAACTALAPRS